MISCCSRQVAKTLICLISLAIWGVSAPLYPDVSDDHWAADAVKALASKGLIEGYPDATFKGDRSASRWEVAMIVARLLAKLDNAETTFATKAELDELRRLANALREELDALGVRITDLDMNLTRIDKRVTELERITFYGHLDARMVNQSFSNRGVHDNSNGLLAPIAGFVPYLNYDGMVGTAAASPLRPQVHALIPVVDYRNGRPLTSGTGFSSLAVLGTRIKISPAISAGAEFAAYTSQGSSEIDGYWGVAQPFLSNPATAIGGGQAQGLNSSPFTKMTLDKFWVEHAQSKTRLNVGNIDRTTVDSFVYAGQTNLNVYGPGRLPGYGFQLLGKVKLAQEQGLSYEVLGTRLGNGVRFEGTSYNERAFAGKLAYEFPRAKLQVNFARVMDESPSLNGGSLGVGLTNGINTPFAASTAWAPRQWVNPPGYYLNELSAGVLGAIGTPGNTADTRPIPGWSSTSDNAIGYGAGAGNYGPQAQNVYGLSASYSIPWGEKSDLNLSANLGRSQYRSNRNSSFQAEGNLLHLAADAGLLKGSLNLGAEYLRVDPEYAALSWTSNLIGVRFPLAMNYTGQFHTFDSNKYPHNRQGWRARFKYSFANKAATVWGEGSFLEQTQTSLYNVRVTGSALGANTPTGDVLGFTPGFVDPVFYGYASPLLYGANSRNSFTASLAPLEDKRGKQNDYTLGGSYAWPNDGLKLSTVYRQYDYHRASSLTAALGGSQNFVDVTSSQLSFSADFPIKKGLRALAGFDVVKTAGHYDPAGLFNIYALATGSTAFKNLDSRQFIPHLGINWQINEKSDFNLKVSYYDTKDRVPSSIAAGSSALGQIGSSVHPFSWSGLSISTGYQLRF